MGKHLSADTGNAEHILRSFHHFLLQRWPVGNEKQSLSARVESQGMIEPGIIREPDIFAIVQLEAVQIALAIPHCAEVDAPFFGIHEIAETGESCDFPTLACAVSKRQFQQFIPAFFIRNNPQALATRMPGNDRKLIIRNLVQYLVAASVQQLGMLVPRVV